MGELHDRIHATRLTAAVRHLPNPPDPGSVCHRMGGHLTAPGETDFCTYCGELTYQNGKQMNQAVTEQGVVVPVDTGAVLLVAVCAVLAVGWLYLPGWCAAVTGWRNRRAGDRSIAAAMARRAATRAVLEAKR